MNCPDCRGHVSISRGDEGTSSYLPLEDESVTLYDDCTVCGRQGSTAHAIIERAGVVVDQALIAIHNDITAQQAWLELRCVSPGGDVSEMAVDEIKRRGCLLIEQGEGIDAATVLSIASVTDDYRAGRFPQ
jgi:hypothetical protein